MTRIQRHSIVALFTLLPVSAMVSAQQFSSWSTPINLGPTVNSSLGDFFPTISKDGLSLYFTSSRNPANPKVQKDWDIYVSQRASVMDPWGPPERLGPDINTPFDEGAPSLSIDGHRMYFSSNRPGGFGGNDIYVSPPARQARPFRWEFPDNVGDAINSEANESNPAIVQDDATGAVTLYFDSNRTVDGDFGPFTDDAGHNGNDIYASILGADETFGPGVLIEDLSTKFLDRHPAVRRDGLEIYFSSNRDGFGLDLWVATRAKTSDSWSTPVNLGALVNTAATDAGPALSFDGTTLYFHSLGTVGGSPPFDLYVATRTKLKERDAKDNRD